MAHSSAPPPIASLALDSLLAQSHSGMRQADGETKCCCGRSQCAYLVSNNAALEGLEKDLQRAAQIGQALLARHEEYVSGADAERRKMEETVTRLEADKKTLEDTNANMIAENRYLLEQLEEMNSNVNTADGQIQALSSALQSTKLEMETMASLAAQTSQLSSQLSELEAEQAQMQAQVATKSEESQTAIERWKKAERTIATLSEQIDHIEREAKEERVRHSEIVSRLERRRAVERELETAAGRLKGAAAATSMGRDNPNNGVISSFVKDILQDNANLQMGIVELREMLMGSNDEVQNLREQVLMHQATGPETKEPKRRPSLDAELLQTTNADRADVHVHHHYHAAPNTDHTAKDKASGIRRQKKKRYVSSPGYRTPTLISQRSRPSLSTPMGTQSPTSAAAILSQTAVTVPSSPSQPPQKAQPEPPYFPHTTQMIQASFPSSPASYFQDNSIFDDTFEAPNSSRPTTPASTSLGSPELRPYHSKRGSDVSVRSLSAQAAYNTTNIGTIIDEGSTRDDWTADAPSFPGANHETIFEEPEEPILSAEQSDGIESPSDIQPTFHSRLHRSNSAESIFSLRDTANASGQRPQPSDTYRHNRPSFGTNNSFIKPVTSSTSAVGRSSLGGSSSYNKLLLANKTLRDQASAAQQQQQNAPERSYFGKRLGGWVIGKWGMAPTSSTVGGEQEVPAPPKAASDVRGPMLRTKTAARKEEASQRLSTHVEAMNINSALLQEALQSGDLDMLTGG